MSGVAPASRTEIDYRRQTRLCAAVASAAVAIPVLDLFAGHPLGDWLWDNVGAGTWSSFHLTIVQVAVPIALAAMAVPFLITSFSTQETTRILRLVHARNRLAWAAAALAVGATFVSLALAAGKQTFPQAVTVALAAVPAALMTGSVAALAGAILVALERLDPYRLARAVTAPLTPASAAAFGLVGRDGSGAPRIVRHNVDFAMPDPLGPFHETMLSAWQARDRVLVRHLLEALIAQALACRRLDLLAQGYTEIRDEPAPRRHRRLPWRRPLRRAPDPAAERLLVHALHYFVRNAGSSSRRWGGGDGQRRIFVMPLLSAHRALTGSPRDERLRCLVLSALVHVASNTTDLTPQGDQEPFALLPVLYGDLVAAHAPQAELDAMAAAIAFTAHHLDLAADPDFAAALGRLGPTVVARVGALDAQGAVAVLAQRAALDPWLRHEPLTVPACAPSDGAAQRLHRLLHRVRDLLGGQVP